MAKIGLNATLLTPKSGGIGEYFINLIAQLHKQYSPDLFEVFISRQYADYARSLLDVELTLVDLPVDRQVKRTFLEPRLWKRTLAHHPVELFHSLVSYVPFGVKSPAVVTVHDLRYFYFPETYHWLRGKYLGMMIPRSVHQARQVIAISEFTKKCLLEKFHIPEDKVQVVYQGLDVHRFRQKFSTEQIHELEKKYRLKKKYILSVGHIEPRKNYVKLIQAYHHLSKKGAGDLDLVIVGKPYLHAESVYETVNELELQDRVHFLGFVDFADLPLLYQLATIFVAPSTFEGFGFTPLEAMAAGVPVAAARASSFPEVLGSAAQFFDPNDPKDIADAILSLFDKDLRAKLLSKANDNIQRFDWQRCARNTMAVYQHILGDLG